jgi:hypothetical protein
VAAFLQFSHRRAAAIPPSLQWRSGGVHPPPHHLLPPNPGSLLIVSPPTTPLHTNGARRDGIRHCARGDGAPRTDRAPLRWAGAFGDRVPALCGKWGRCSRRRGPLRCRASSASARSHRRGREPRRLVVSRCGRVSSVGASAATTQRPIRAQEQPPSRSGERAAGAMPQEEP